MNPLQIFIVFVLQDLEEDSEDGDSNFAILILRGAEEVFSEEGPKVDFVHGIPFIKFKIKRGFPFKQVMFSLYKAHIMIS